MEKSALILESSPWFVLICLIVGALTAYLLYKPSGPWGKQVNYVLTAVRFLLVSLLCFLLVGPIIKHLKNRVEQPQIVVALDNSQSLAEVMDSVQQVNLIDQVTDLVQALQSSNFEVQLRTLTEDEQDAIKFDQPSTPLNSFLGKIQSDYEGKNLKSVVLVSDGIYNQGLSPVYAPYKFPVHTVGLGDTIPQKDIQLKAILYNKIAYQGNQFILRADILNEGFIDTPLEVVLSESGRVLQRKNIRVSNSPQLLQLDFTVEAQSKGLKDYLISVNGVEGEFTLSNNQRHAYIDVIEGQRKILLAARGPHPDIKAIKSTLDNNQNYQTDLYIPGISNPELDTYDLIILHQMTQQEARQVSLIANLLSNGTPTWTIVGSKSNLPRFNSENPLVEIVPINYQRDQVTAQVSGSFSKFQLSEPLKVMLANNNPVNVPFANYKLSAGAEVLLTQKVGNLATDNPMLMVMDDGDQKQAVLIGEGIWQWRLQDYDRNQSFTLFDELVSKLVQYLSSNQEKSRFRLYPINSEFQVNEPVILQSEVYNEIYEEVYGNNIDLSITDGTGQSQAYNFTTSEGNTQYRINDLPSGVYSFRASTEIDGKSFNSRGQFSVTDLQLESLDLTADHQMLKELAAKTDGQFFNQAQWTQLQSLLAADPAQGVIYSEEAFMPLIRWPWVLVLLLVLVSIEWFIRKYYGSY